ncbi:MAG: monovalent cation/H+ antiporter subunit A [Aquimonas sp.]
MLEILLAAPFVCALLIALAHKGPRSVAAAIAALAPLTGLAILASITPEVMEGEVVRSFTPWIAEAGLNLSLRIDGLAWMFAGLVLGIGLLIVLYAHYYLSPKDSAPRFFAYLMLFMGAMLGMVIAGNLLLLATFWELTSISSFLLIGFWSHRDDARKGARMALAITGAGGLALLAGVLVIGHIVGSYELDAVLDAGDAIRAHALYPVATLLVLGGVVTKSAQFPFHFWLPHAMAAPTPVSAYLHSATMVKAGVFLLARMHPALAGTDLWFYTVSGFGAATLLTGAYLAIFQHDLKGLLAYSTVSHLGLITLLFGLPTELAVVAGVFHILNHAVFKASLFMAAGIIDHETGTRDIRKLHGLLKTMPITSTLAIIAALSMAGIPFLNGFLSKEMFFAETLQVDGHGAMGWALAIAAVLAGIFSMAYSLRFVHDCFFTGSTEVLNRTPHEPPRLMRVPVEILVLLCLAVGVAPAWVIGPVLETAVRGATHGNVPDYYLAVWHGFNLPLLMSAIAVAGGIALYFGLRRFVALHRDVRGAFGFAAFHWKIDLLTTFSRGVTQRLEDGSLQRYLLLMVLSALVLAAAPFLMGFSMGGFGEGQSMPLFGWVLWALLIASTIAVPVLHRDRLTALIVMGGTGLLVSLSFVMLSAPDLALTQLLVETVSVILLLLALNYLPAEGAVERSALRRGRDLGIAVACGAGVTALVYAIITRPLDTVAGEILARSVPEGGGTNVVNVILVDFRGFDTLGELTVFGIAGLVVHALLRRAWITPDELYSGVPERLSIPNTLARLLLPLALAAAVYLFLRGHNQPGGGFIAGLVLVSPLVLQYILSGSRYVEQRIGFDYAMTIGWGVLIGTATGVAAWVFGYPFLTSAYGYIELPIVGKFALSSAMAFDTGVLLAVCGGALLILASLGHVRRPRAPQPAHPAIHTEGEGA